MRRIRVVSAVRRFWKTLGPGIITGASDDDPSGIVTYSIAGAKTGFGMLWCAWLTMPLMAAVQEMCARIGIVTGSGLAGVMKRRYSRLLLWSVMTLLIAANTINIGADLAGMGEALALIIPLPAELLSFVVTAAMVMLIIFLPYRKLAWGLKWLCFALFAYILAAFVSGPDWSEVLRQAVFPRLSWNADTVILLTAIFGTTISPYLFFWQTSEEVEDRMDKSKFRSLHHIVTRLEIKEMRKDVAIGMFFSNLVMFFIMVNTATVLHGQGIADLETAGQVAMALEPLAGPFASLLFAIGIIGTGLLAIPVLAGSAAYTMAETLGLSEGLNKRFQEAKAFYGLIIASTFVGFAMNFIGLSPIKALFGSAVINGMLAPFLILLVLDICNSKMIMGNKRNTLFQNTLGVIAFLIMSLAAIATLVFTIAGMG